MRKDAWLEYGSPGTTILSRKDVERAVARMKRFWHHAVEWDELCLPRERGARVHIAPHKPQSHPAFGSLG